MEFRLNRSFRCVSHAGTVVPECFKDDNASQWKSEKFDPPLPQKPLNRSSPKFAWVITSWTPTSMQNFITIRLLPFAPQICENGHQVTRLVFFWFFRQPTAKTPTPTFTINTSNDVVSRKDVPFGGPENNDVLQCNIIFCDICCFRSASYGVGVGGCRP